MTATTTKSTSEKAREVGAKTPADKKKAASAKVKAMQAEAADGDQVIELRGETFVVHVAQFQEKTEDYNFFKALSAGIIPMILPALLGGADIERIETLAWDDEKGYPSTEKMAELFQELMEATGQGN